MNNTNEQLDVTHKNDAKKYRKFISFKKHIIVGHLGDPVS